MGNMVRMEYDGNGNLTQETGSLGESRSYTYTPVIARSVFAYIWPNGIPEFQVTGYPYSVSGKGRADLVLFRQSFVIRSGNTVEVYEIKPITERDTGKGNIQREGYEFLLWLIEQAVWIYNTGFPSPSPCPI